MSAIKTNGIGKHSDSHINRTVTLADAWERDNVEPSTAALKEVLSPETERRQEVQEGIGKRMRPRQAYNTEAGTQVLPVETPLKSLKPIPLSLPQQVCNMANQGYDTEAICLKFGLQPPQLHAILREYNRIPPK